MSYLGTALLGEIFGHSGTEKTFRPWWDTLEDFLIYGLIMLGIIVSPTSIIGGTPLFCTLCQLEHQCGNRTYTKEDPGYHLWWVKSYCTLHEVKTFTMYFPYILLLSALLLLAFERFFIKLFKSTALLESFHSLLQNSEQEGTIEAVQAVNKENTIKCVEVRQSFKKSSSYYKSYLARTWCEVIFGAGLFFFLSYFGVPAIWEAELTFCDVHGTWYECAGIPHEFYLIVLFIALAILVVYLLSTFWTLWWLALPCLGQLSRLMNAYRRELHLADMTTPGDSSSEVLLKELYEIYYNSKDLRLLLDLLSATSGLAPPLRVMALLDNNFRNQCKPVIISLERSQEIQNGEGDMILMFTESKLVRNIFSKMEDLHCIYTVQILPRTDDDSVEVVVFDRNDIDNFMNDMKEIKGYFRNRVTSTTSSLGDTQPEVPTKRIVLKGADTDTAYTVQVSLVLNGRAIATSQKKAKAVVAVKEADQDNEL